MLSHSTFDAQQQRRHALEQFQCGVAVVVWEQRRELQLSDSHLCDLVNVHRGVNMQHVVLGAQSVVLQRTAAGCFCSRGKGSEKVRLYTRNLSGTIQYSTETPVRLFETTRTWLPRLALLSRMFSINQPQGELENTERLVMI